MSWSRKLALTLFGATLLVVGAFTARSIVRHGEVLPGVSVGGIDVGRLGRADLTEAVLAIEDELLAGPVSIVVEGTSFPLDAAQVEFSLDRQAMIEAALDAGRRSGFKQFADWVTSRRYDIELTGSLSESAVAVLIDQWEAAGITEPAFNGAVRFENGTVIADPPRAGRRVERDSASGLILAALMSRVDRTAVLDVVDASPDLDAGAVEEALSTAAVLTAEPIVLEGGEPAARITFSRNELGRALTSQFVAEPEPALELGFDPEVIAETLAPFTGSLEAPPRDAAFATTGDDEVTIVPGRSGTVVDPDLVAAQLLVAAYLPDRLAPLPFAQGVEPDFTTADAEALGVVGKVSEFTTFHPCCQPRVTNIQRMADLVDGVIVLPGEEFSLNEHVGLRTEENGFVEAPMILRGEFVPSVGGGVSQFATTLFNAVFYGGYEDVYHQPHSYYFSRYPEAREATVSFPNPELIFRNDTAAALLIRTEHTDESITVKFFGDNEGRRVSESLSPRRNFRNPVVEYVTDSGLTPGSEVVLDRGTTGWTVTLTRVISYPDRPETTEEWDWTYRPQPRRVRVHPCDVPGAGITCPTTTTLPPPTTTTSTSSTTTTSTSTSTSTSTTTTTTTVP
ncbi:MAG: VanW family protein [Acidimicrobiia bacterium]|nr:VanW family protein [Acidimicrobiia bacterium]